MTMNRRPTAEKPRVNPAHTFFLLLAVAVAAAVFIINLRLVSSAARHVNVDRRPSHASLKHAHRRRRVHRFNPAHDRQPRPPVTSLASTVTFCPILMFHYVRIDSDPNDYLGQRLSIPPHRFMAEMRYIRRHGFHTVTIDQLARHIRYGSPLPSNPVALTFDDGYRDHFTRVLPVLRRFGLKATFFIVSSFVGTPRYMTWRQIRILNRAGMDIGVHTVDHLDLTLLSPEQIWQEVHESKMIIERHLGHPARTFAYPSGRFDAQVIQDVQRSGYLAAVSTLPGSLHAQSSVDYLFRVEILNSVTPQTIGAYLTWRFGQPFEATPTVP